MSSADGTFLVPALRGSGAYELTVHDDTTGIPLVATGELRPIVSGAAARVEAIRLTVPDSPAMASDRIDSRTYYKLTTRWQTARSLDSDVTEVAKAPSFSLETVSR